ncbi:putative blue pigment (indigoidine) exporter [Stackebrandtia albiflava]|uniref:Putative blue pigment (Indigoidine) exporter n=1 Tax=Stackebrandtia albiflava TaxID=406432 RepID=A0A562VH45_9ACTN|nr:EamA family transporter [Stackebrandtia albiflava]TWJ17180.1 putative blue pigment (indigoidine) exporter [Stackebrandtia albiflava]
MTTPVSNPSPARLTVLTALAPVSWGTTYLVTTEFLPPGIPLLSAVIRLLPAGLCLVLVARVLPRGRWWWRSAVLGTLNIGAFNALLFVAAYRLPGGVAATLTAVQPLLVAAIGYLVLRDRPTGWRLGWGAAGVAGVGLMVLRGPVGFDAVGLLAGIAAAASMATGIVLTRRWGRPEGVGTLAFTGWQLTASGLLLTPVALAAEGLSPVPDAAAWGGYAWLAVVGTAIAYVLWFGGLGRLPVAAVSFLPLLSPAVATLLGLVVLGETLTPPQCAGFVLALLAIAAAQTTPAIARERFRRHIRPTAGTPAAESTEEIAR